MTRKTKKRLCITGIVLAVLIVIALCAAYFIGFDNFKAAYYGFKYDKEEIKAMLDEGSERLSRQVSEHGNITAREPTPEEIKALEAGEITEDQLAELIASGMTLEEYLKKNPSDKPEDEAAESESGSEAEKPSGDSGNQESEPASSGEPAATNQASAPAPQSTETPAPQEAPAETAPTAADLQAECDAKVSQIVAKMYILRSSYTGSLAGLAGQAYADYTAGVPKATIVSNYMGQGYGLEAQCDASVGALMSELTGILTQYGQPTDLVNTIYAAYESEKQYTKAYYMSLYLNN